MSLRWFLLHLPHALLLPILGLTVITFLHELAHCGAALAQGANVVEFAFLPTAERLGHMRYELPRAMPGFSPRLVSAAPYLMWLVSAATVAGVAALPGQRLHPAFASTLFVWGYVVPVGDVFANLGAGDLYLPGLEGLVLSGVVAVVVAGCWALAYPVQKRLYGKLSLSATAFVGLSAVLLPLVVGLRMI